LEGCCFCGVGMELDSIECVPSLDLTDEDEIHHHHHLHHFPSVSKPHTTTTTNNNNSNSNSNTVASAIHTTSVHELLECPVCTNSMYPPIHQVWPPFLLSFFLFNMIMHMVLPFLFRVFNC